MTALLVIDVQNDFTQGSLSLENAPSNADIGLVIEKINFLLKNQYYDSIVYTLDYHPPNHCSFDKWPKHCVSGTWGVELDKRLIAKPPKCGDFFLIKKGTSPTVDSYSAFIDNERKKETELRGELLRRNIDRIMICGLALDYCVYYTAIDALYFGFKTTILRDCTASYHEHNSQEYIEKLENLSKAGIELLYSKDL